MPFPDLLRRGLKCSIKKAFPLMTTTRLTISIQIWDLGDTSNLNFSRFCSCEERDDLILNNLTMEHTTAACHRRSLSECSA